MPTSVSLFKLLVPLAGFFSVVSTPAFAQATLAKVKKQGYVMCGVTGDLAGFSATDAKGQVQGIDADLCRAVAAAVGVEARFKPLNATTRFTALQSGEVDVLTRNTTWSLSRDTKLAFDFPAVNYYDGQGFMVSKALKVTSAKGLDGASICVQSGTTTELNLTEYFKVNKMKFKPVVFANFNDANKAYAAGRCDAYTTDASGLAAIRSSLKVPGDHLILPEIISKEPLGPATRHGDNVWTDVVRWTFFALVTAEEKGLTKANVKSQATNADPEVQRLVGAQGTLGADMGLDKNWAVNAIAAVGNWAEIFDRHLGASTPLKIERGLNRLWNKGGLLYSPPFN
jgi:general L-amino acid transport system substrate-binding protein